MKKFFSISLLALAGSFLASHPASAQTTVNSNSAGDLLLSFRATGGTGNATNLEVNLGSFVNFTHLTPGQTISLTGSTGLQFSDLASTANGYGSNWASRTDLFWSIAGTTATTNVDGQGLRTLFISYASGQLPTVASSNFQTAPMVAIRDMVGLLNGRTATSDSSVNGALGSSKAAYVETSNGSSYTGASGGAQQYYGYFGFEIEKPTNVTNSPATLDLYELKASNSGDVGIKVGTFSLSSNAFTFTAAPEPGSVMLLGVSGLTLLFRRRRSAISA